MGYVSSPWPLLFYQLVGHPFWLWGASFWYLCCTCSNLHIIYACALVAFAMSHSCDCAEKKNILDILYIYMLLLCCCYACAILWVCCCYVADMLLSCCCYAAAMLLLCIWYVVLCCCYAVAVLMLCCCAVVAYR